MDTEILRFVYCGAERDADGFEVASIKWEKAEDGWILTASIPSNISTKLFALSEVEKRYIRAFCSSVGSADQATLHTLVAASAHFEHGPLRGLREPRSA